MGMEAFAILAMLILMCRVGLNLGLDPPAGYTWRQGDCPENDIIMYSQVNSIEQCCTLCSRIHRCVAVQADTDANECWIKYLTCKTTTKQTTNYKNTLDKTRSIARFTTFVNTSTKPDIGIILSSRTDPTILHCSMACLQIEQCSFFTYEKASGECQLIDVLSAASTLGTVGTGDMYKLAGF